MLKYLLPILLLFPSWLVHALEEGAAAAASEPVDMVYVVLFGILFFGMIAGFFVYLWWQEKHRDTSE
jgi:ABC-type uncharacterized transport system permease subunit